MADISLSTLQSRLEARVETVSGFSRSLRPLDPAMDPGALQDKRYAVELESRNEGAYRDKAGSRLRMAHDATVFFLRRLPPKAQNTRYAAALDDELDIIKAFLDQSGAWQQDLRVSYTGTSRDVLDTGEWLIIGVSFEIHHDLDLS